MELKFAGPGDKDALKEMWSYCFGDRDPFLSWYFDFIYSPQNTLAAYDGDTPLSNLQLIPYKIGFYNACIDMSYLVGVATMPEIRNTGVISRLLGKSLQIMRERRNPIAILLPFNYEFYRKYGWETCYYHLEYKVNMDNIKPLVNNYGHLKPAPFPECIETLDAIYKASNKDRSGYILRTGKNWEGVLQDHIFDGGYIYVLENSDGKTSGYILYRIEDNIFNVREMAYTDNRSAGGIWRFIYNHSAQAQTVVWNAPFDDLTFMKLKDAREPVSVKPFVMARIVDAYSILELILENTEEKLTLSILVEDSFAPWNNGVFHINTGISKEDSGFLRFNPSPGNSNVHELKSPNLTDARLSINTLTCLAMGTIDAIQAENLGLLECSNHEAVRKLNLLFKRQINYINDYF